MSTFHEPKYSFEISSTIFLKILSSLSNSSTERKRTIIWKGWSQELHFCVFFARTEQNSLSVEMSLDCILTINSSPKPSLNHLTRFLTWVSSFQSEMCLHSSFLAVKNATYTIVEYINNGTYFFLQQNVLTLALTPSQPLVIEQLLTQVGFSADRVVLHLSRELLLHNTFLTKFYLSNHFLSLLSSPPFSMKQINIFWWTYLKINLAFTIVLLWACFTLY